MGRFDEYLDLWGSSQERSLAPTRDRTSERSVNVPMPVLPGALEGFEGVIADYAYSANPAPPPATPTYARAPAYTQSSTPQRTAAVPRSAPAPLYNMIGARPTKAAGRSAPSTSPAKNASLPSSVDASRVPPPPPPVDTPSMSAAINTNATHLPAAPTGAPPTNDTTNNVSCPPCSCPGGISTGSILLLIGAAGVVLWMGSEKFDRFRKTPG